jgi:hypothetical protein
MSLMEGQNKLGCFTKSSLFRVVSILVEHVSGAYL